MQDPDRKDSDRKGARRRRRPFWLHLLLDGVRAVAVLLFLHAFVFQFSVVRGSSMRPNISDGDRLLVDRASYVLGAVDRFDVVIMTSPKNRGVDYVKRIVGLPGDRIELGEGQVRVNGRPIDEPFDHVADRSCEGQYIVPKGSYFVLGDNRPVSSDSREGWFVRADLIKGKVRACVWPVGRVRSF